jgi:hypothetical protein
MAAMSEGPVKSWVNRVRQAVFTLLMMAAGVRVAWAFLAPVVPILVSLIVVLVVLSVALFGRRSS